MLNGNDLEFLSGALPFYKHLDEADRHAVALSGSKSEYGRGEIILNAEKECNGLVVVKSGQLRALFETEDGKEITLYRLLPGDICILTASCVLKNITFEVSLEVEKDSEVFFIPAVTWSSLIEKNIAVRKFSMELVSERFSEVMWIMEQIVSRNMGQRIAAFLLEQSALEGSDTLTVTHETIARNLGTAREVISRILKYLENDGALKLSRGQIRLTDRKMLEEMNR